MNKKLRVVGVLLAVALAWGSLPHTGWAADNPSPVRKIKPKKKTKKVAKKATNRAPAQSSPLSETPPPSKPEN
jgi:hypothetical protein